MLQPTRLARWAADMLTWLGLSRHASGASHIGACWNSQGLRWRPAAQQLLVLSLICHLCVLQNGWSCECAPEGVWSRT